MTVFAADQGAQFGTWDNDTSRLMYRDAMPALLNGVDTSGRVADYGGANGLLKAFISGAVSIDVDASKEPDVVADITTHVGIYDLIVMRYVLHYLSDAQVARLFEHLRSFHRGRLLVIQFVNDDLEAKAANSVNETKWFRTEDHLVSLFGGWDMVDHKRLDYSVSAQFYRDRLGHPNPVGHREAVGSYYLEPQA